jgi:hypothetical protein
VATSNQLAPPDRSVKTSRLNDFVNWFGNVPPRRSAQDGASGEESMLPLDSLGVNAGRNLANQGN